MTLSDLSKKLCSGQSPDELLKASRKIQNWVTDGIVLPVTGKNEGRGVHRRYDQHEACKIAVLFEATRFKLPGVILQELSGLFDDSRPIDAVLQSKIGVRKEPSLKKQVASEFNELLKRANTDKSAYMSVIPSDDDRSIQVSFSSDEKFIRNNSSAIVLNLTKILSTLSIDNT